MSIELGEIFFRKSDSKIFSIREIIPNGYETKYKLVSNDKETIVLTLDEIKKGFN